MMCVKQRYRETEE